MDVRAVFIDGRRFHKHGVIVAIGVAAGGWKFVLGIHQADTEHSASCLALLSDLEARGLMSEGLLLIIDVGLRLSNAI